MQKPDLRLARRVADVGGGVAGLDHAEGHAVPLTTAS